MPSLWDLFVRISGDNSSYKTAIKDAEGATDAFGLKFEALDKKLSSAVGWASVGTAIAGAASFAVGAALKFDEAGKTIQKMTGATGAELEGLQQSLKSVFSVTTASADEVAKALSYVQGNTALTGTALNELTLASIRFAKITGTDVAKSVDDVGDLFSQWGIAATQQTEKLDKLMVVYQKSQIPVEKLVSSLAEAGPVLRSLGFSFDESAALAGNFENAGLNLTSVLGGLSKGMINLAAAGKDPKAALLELIDKLENAKTSAAAVNEATEIFGRKGAVVLQDAVRRGAFDIKTLVEQLDGASGAIAKTARDTETFAGKWTKFTHALEADLEPAGKAVINYANTAMENFESLAGFIDQVLKRITDSLKENEIAAMLLGLSPGDKRIDASTSSNVLAATIKAISMMMNPPAPVNAPNNGIYGPDPRKLTAGGGGADPDALIKTLEVTEKYRAIIDEFNVGTAIFQKQVQVAKQGIQDMAEWLLVGAKRWEILKVTSEGSMLSLPPEFRGVAESMRMSQDVMDGIDKKLQDVGINVHAVGGAWQDLADAAAYFGIQTRSQLEETVNKSGDFYERMKRTGLATAEELSEAFVKYKLAQIELDHKLGDTDDELYAQQKKNAEDALKTLEGDHVGVQRQIKDRFDLGKEMENLAHKTFDDFERGFAKMVVTADFSFKSIKDLISQLGVDMYSIMLKSFFKPLEDKFASWIGSIFGTTTSAAGAATSTAASSAGGATSAAGGVASAASGGILGAVGAIGSAVSAVFSGLSFFQGRREEQDIGRIEVTTRGMLNELQNLRSDLWSQFGSNYYRLGEVLNSIRGGGGGGGGNTFNFYQTDINEVVRQLKLCGVLPS